MWNKELKQGGGPEADSYGTGPEGDVARVTWIGNRVKIGNSSGIDREWRRLLNREDESYARDGEEAGLAGVQLEVIASGGRSPDVTNVATVMYLGFNEFSFFVFSALPEIK